MNKDMAKKNIYDYDRLYSILRPIVDLYTKASYRAFEIHGIENVPKEGAVIITPNHCNTLMDALVVLATFKDETVFGARADMFNKPAIAKIMFFLRILPMVRQRDGLRNVLKNNETTGIIVNTLKHGVRFCMYAEGRHRPARSIMPLGKGVFRAALSAVDELGESKNVYIVPAGLEYEDYFRFRSTALLSFGEPINVTEFVRNNHVENEVQLIEPLRKELYSRMSEQITYLPDDENLASSWTLLKMIAARECRCGSLHDKMMRNRTIALKIADMKAADPEGFKALLEKVSAFDNARRKAGISIFSFGKKHPALSLAGRTAASIALLPWFIFCAVVASPMWLTFNLLKGKIKDKAFRNTAGFGVGLAMSILLYIIYGILSFCLLPWYWAGLLMFAFIPSYYSFHDCLEYYRRTISDFRFIGKKNLKKKFSEIITIVNNIY